MQITIGKLDLIAFQGTDLVFDATVKNDDGTVVNLTGYSFEYSGKQALNSGTEAFPTGAALSSVTATDAVNGKLQFRLKASFTTNNTGDFLHSARMTSPGGIIYPIFTGSVKVIPTAFP